MINYYTLNVSETIKLLKSSEKGLAKREVKKRLRKFGYNELQKEKRLTALIIFGSNLGRFKFRVRNDGNKQFFIKKSGGINSISKNKLFNKIIIL